MYTHSRVQAPDCGFLIDALFPKKIDQNRRTLPQTEVSRSAALTWASLDFVDRLRNDDSTKLQKTE